MKTFLSSLFVLISFIVNSQIIEVKIEEWGEYSHPETMTLHSAMELDSVTTSLTRIGSATYTFNLNSDKLVVVMVDSKNNIKKFNIVKIIPTKSVLNVDAEIEGRYYNFVIAENDGDNMSLIIQNFKKENGKSAGLFCNNAKYVIK